MDRMGYFSIIAPDMGKIFILLGAISTLPLLVCAVFQEWEVLIPMVIVPVVFFLLGSLLVRQPEQKRESRLSIALASVALIWLISAIIGSIPFILALKMPITDSIFEAMSGWTSTGLSLVPSVDDTPKTILFWRSFMQWVGGIGIVAFTIALSQRSGLIQRGLYRSEGRAEAFMPSVVATAAQMWKIYIVITAFSIGLVLISGIPVWDAVNLAMTAIATGGFSVHSAGISFYDNPLLEMLLIPVMIAGALPFKLYYLMYTRRKVGIFGDRQAQLLFTLFFIGCVVVTFDLITRIGLDIGTAIRQGIFMVASGITCTGFQNTSLAVWSSVTILFLSALMFIGGSSGSTAGGIKLNRVILGLEGLVWWFKRIFVSGNVLVPFRHEGKSIPKKIAEIEVSKNMLIIILFFFTIMVSTFTVFHLEAQTPYETSEVIFELISAMSNVGISTGFVSPEMGIGSKWLFIFLMWFGRLELVPVIVLFMGLWKGFD
jgi:trk system potassium uptake protein TrkH